MDIAATLRRYDGKRVEPFRAVAEAVRDAPESALGELLDLAGSAEMEDMTGLASQVVGVSSFTPSKLRKSVS